MSEHCCARGGHAGRVIVYRRGSLYGSGKGAWRRAHLRMIEGGRRG